MGTGTELIFLSIASYRDPQLVPTIQDCLAKAFDPARLRFGVHWQHGAEELPRALWEDDRFRILDTDWRDSQGACWARAEAMKLWAGEAWFLQIDSHCRFKADWDRLLIEAARSLPQPRVVLSTYATPFVPGPEEELREAPLEIAFQGFTAEGIPFLKPLALRQEGTGKAMRRARFLSAGFLFAPGSFVQEVPYDPGLYFVGEEIAMTLRAFTHGYDLYHPRETIVWHDYLRADATKHWDDHVEGKDLPRTWGERDLASKERVRRLLAGERLEGFDLGRERSLQEYEAYAGISFGRRRVQDYTMRAAEPPNPPMPEDWADHIYPWMVRLVVRRDELPRGAQQATLWYLGVHDEFGNEVYRRDLNAAEIQALPTSGPEIILICELQSGSVPAAWTVWPVDAAGRWLRKVEGRLREGDYAIALDEAEPDMADAG